jgi:hypothetical protein
MKHIPAMAVAAWTLAALAAHAQGSGSLDGKWNLSWTGTNGSPQEAVIELRGDSGEFKLMRHIVRGKPDPCDSIAAPVQLERAGEEINVTARYSAVLGGCRDRVMTLRRVSDAKLEGAFKSGTAVSATR